MGRHAVLERIQQVAEPLANRIARVAEDLEYLFLQPAIVNADASPTQLVAVAQDVVCGAPAVVWPLLYEREVVLHRWGEGPVDVLRLAIFHVRRQRLQVSREK